MLSAEKRSFAASLAACSILLSSCAEILVAPALDNVHDPLSSTFVPGQSGGLSATQVSDRAVKLSWVRGSQFIVSNRVERKPSGGAFQVLGALSPDSTRFVDTTGVLLGVSYSYRIGAVAANGNIAYSQEAGFSLLFPRPALTSASDSARYFVRLTWVDSSGFASGYIIERESGTGVYSEIGRSVKGGESFVDLTADTGKINQYRVRAFTSVNVSPPSSPVTFRYLLETQQTSLSIPGARLSAISPTGDLVASVGGTNSATVNLYSLVTGALVRSFVTNSPAIYGAAISPDGSLLVAACVDSLRIWNLAGGSPVRSFPGFYGNARFNRSGTLLAAANWSTSTILLFDPATWKAVQEVPGGYDVAISPDGSTVASHVMRADGNGFAIDVRNVGSGVLIGSYGSRYAEGDGIRFDPTGRFLVSDRFDYVYVTRVSDGAVAFQSPAGTYWSPVDVNSTGSYFAAEDQGSLYLWSLNTFQLLLSGPPNNTPIGSVGFLPDGYRFLGGAASGLRLWWIQGRWKKM